MSFDVKAGLLQGFCLDFCEENQMAVKVMIPTPLRVYAGKRDSAEFTAATVGEALGHLTTQFGDLRKHLFTEDGKLRSFVNVYVNDEDIRYLAKENTPTKDGDTISIVPSIAGGSFSPYRCCRPL
jgi:molybdopterin converting factor small subunit